MHGALVAKPDGIDHGDTGNGLNTDGSSPTIYRDCDI